MCALRLSQLYLKDIGPFEEVTVDFSVHPGISFICGDNGIGKTTLLEAIATFFAQGQPRIKKKAASPQGHLNIVLFDGFQRFSYEGLVREFSPEKPEFLSLLPQLAENVINIRASRDFSYQKAISISRDPDINQHVLSNRVSTGLDTAEIKSWFANRYLLSPHRDSASWTLSMLSNLELATKLFSVLDPSVKLAEVDVTSFDIIVSTPSGLIPFEYLSSGFRSTFSLFLGIVKEIEYRKLGVSAVDFDGIVLIDEIELHLHPSWQRRVGHALRLAFPNAQIICTTHSPHVIQAARSSEVISLSRSADGSVFVRDLPSMIYGYVGWTLEEILQDVMGVPDTKTAEFRVAMLRFDEAVDRNDASEVRHALSNLQEMLHPQNSLRKLLEIQAAPIIGAPL